MTRSRMPSASAPKQPPPQPTRFATLEPLEPRRLLSAAYSLTDLGTSSAIPGVISLNNNGQVLTVSVDSNNKVVYGITSHGNSTPLPANLKNADPLVIANLGRVLGAMPGRRTATYSSPGGFTFNGAVPPFKTTYRLPDAFVFDGTTVRDIGPGFATASNSSGVIVGVTGNFFGYNAGYFGPGGPSWPTLSNGNFTGKAAGVFVYSAGKRHVLKPCVQGSFIRGVGIDDAGDVMVASVDGIYVYAAGSKKATKISTLKFDKAVMGPGYVAGTIAGHGYSVSATGQTTDWGLLGSTDPIQQGNGTIIGINASGQIVGTEVLPYAVVTYFVTSNGVINDLKTLVPPGWSVSPVAINDAGQLAATGSTAADPAYHSLLLTPTTPA